MKGRTLLSKPEECQGGQCGWSRVGRRTAGCRVRGARGQAVWASWALEGLWLFLWVKRAPCKFLAKEDWNSLKISKTTQAALLRMACDLAVS